MPHRESVPMGWRLKEHRYSLTGSECLGCKTLHMPPRQVCDCGSEQLKPVVFSGKGEIVSYTTIHVAPAGFERQTPYNIALVKLAEGPVVSGVVVDSDGVAIGKMVRSVFRKLQAAGDSGVITYGFKFELDATH